MIRSTSNKLFKNSKTTKQIILVVFASILSLACYFVYSSYKMHCEQTLYRLEAIAKTLSGQIDGDKHKELTDKYNAADTIKTNTQEPLYFDVYKKLIVAQHQNELKSEISTLIYIDSLKQFFYVVNSSNTPYYLEQYPQNQKDFTEHYYTGGILKPYSDTYGKWLSAVSPIKDSRGNVVAIVEVDEKYDDFLDVIDEALYHKIAMSLLLFVIIAFILLRYLRQILLGEEEVKKELAHSYDIINQHNVDMLNSINYAKKIQSALLPPKQLILKNLPESFLFYLQKDIVSGDFYFFKEIIPQQKFIIAACDCTGHGVPGALMSMIGSNFLEHIIEDDCFSPGKILTQLNKSIIGALKQDGVQTEGRDGMDVALCLIDKTTNTLTFSGANRPLYILDENGMHTEIKGNKRPIGGFDNSLYEFEEEAIKLMPNNSYFIFSDGYADQFGGEKNKKLSTKRFKSFLTEIHQEPMIKQEEIVAAYYKDWKSNNEQTDDVLVIGFKVI